MRKSVMCMLLGLVIIVSLLSGCAGKSSDSNQRKENTVDEDPSHENSGDPLESESRIIGITMPNNLAERWNRDADSMKEQLESQGYIVKTEFADNDVQKQTDQIETFLAEDVDCLVIAAVDSYGLVDVLEQAKEKEVPVIAYDRLLMNTDAVSYYVSFNNRDIGTKIGEYVVQKKDLEAAQEAGESYTVEFFMGSPDDNNARFLYNGLMEILQPYLDDGTLVCRSGRTSFEDTSILQWSQENAQKNCEDILSANYVDEDIDIICTAFDGLAYGVRSALEGAGYNVNNADSKEWPLITGQDAEVMAIKGIMEGYQGMSVFKDAGVLAKQCSDMVGDCLTDEKPDINSPADYDNGIMVVQAYLCEGQTVDIDNYQKILIDSGYYETEQFE